MGTDITVMIELNDGSGWQFVGFFSVFRNYDLFRLLADVLPGETPISVVGKAVDFLSLSLGVDKILEDIWWHDCVKLSLGDVSEVVERMSSMDDIGRMSDSFVKCYELMKKIERLCGVETRIICVFDS